MQIRFIIVVRLVEQEVGGELLVFIAGEISLYGLILRKSEADKALNCVPLLFSHSNLLGSGRKRRIVVASGFAEQLKELLRVLCDELGKLRVAGTELLQNRLQHLRLLLDHLPQLLELSVVAEPFEIPKALLLLSRCNSGRSCRARACTRAASTACARTATLLSGEIKEVDVPVIVATRSGGRGGGGRRCSLGGSRGLLLPEVFGYALGSTVSLPG